MLATNQLQKKKINKKNTEDEKQGRSAYEKNLYI